MLGLGFGLMAKILGLGLEAQVLGLVACCLGSALAFYRDLVNITGC